MTKIIIKIISIKKPRHHPGLKHLILIKPYQMKNSILIISSFSTYNAQYIEKFCLGE